MMNQPLESLDAQASLVWGRYPVARPGDALQRHTGTNGFSGACLWRVANGGGEFRLRAWPASDDEGPRGMTKGRLKTIHALVALARQNGLEFVPEVLATKDDETVVLHAGRLWEAADWMPGECDRIPPRPIRVENACRALAQLHRNWPAGDPAVGPCPAIGRRLRIIADWQDFAIRANRPFMPPAAAAWLVVAQQTVTEYLPELPALLAPWINRSVPLQFCLCDVWRPHVLFVGDRVSGVIDYGSVKMDHVAGDLSRLLGSWVGGNESLWELGLDAYAAVRPLDRAERLLAKVLDRSGIILGLATWLLWICRDGRKFDDMEAVADRVRVLVAQARSPMLSLAHGIS